MNRSRRERIEKAMNILSECRDEEGGAFSNMPENLQASERGEGFEQNIEQLEEAVMLLEDILNR